MPSMPDSAPEVNERLEDVSAAGRSRPWRLKRRGAERLTQAWRILRRPDKAWRTEHCGTLLVFAECPQDGTKHLHRANFCKERLCPMCAWRRSLRWAAEVSAVLHIAAAEQPRWGYVLLTLTQRNVPGSQLPGEVDAVLRAWGRLTKRKEFRGVAGWLRTLEVTRSKQGTWHPHVHALLAVRPDYWHKQYVSHRAWVAAWRDVLGLDYTPIVEVHRVRQRRGDTLDAAAREVGKYTVKDGDMLPEDATDDEIARRVEVLHRALAGRRLIAWGGELRRIAQLVAPHKDEDTDEDLVHVTGEEHGPTCPVCGSEMAQTVYRWVAAAGDYYRVASPPTRDDDDAT